MGADIHCHHCNRDKIRLERMPIARGGYHLRASCALCGRFIKFVPHQGTVLPFGKHKGLTVIEISIMDPTYLKWLVSKDILREGRLKDAVEFEVVTA